ncbi:MAG TPA: serine hydrolase [Geobacteraceae bacterium]|nr:serine hydrolase [Geobacteraceae bacterium]
MKIILPVLGLLILALSLGRMPVKRFVQKPRFDIEYGISATDKNKFMPILEIMKEDAQMEVDKNEVKDIALYYRDLNSGEWLSINKDEKFVLASLIKVPLMMECLDSMESHPEWLKKRIRFAGDKDWTSQQDIKPKKTLQRGKSYSLDEIMYRMIAYSDNNAMAMLLDKFPSDLLFQYFAEHNIDYDETPDGLEMSLGAYAWFFETLYNESLHDNAMSRKALSYLAAEDFSQGMHAAVPANVVVESKFGEKLLLDENGKPKCAQLHEVGIVLDGNHPFILGIMSDGADLTVLEKVIQHITHDVYEEIEHNASELPDKTNCTHSQCHA